MAMQDLETAVNDAQNANDHYEDDDEDDDDEVCVTIVRG